MISNLPLIPAPPSLPPPSRLQKPSSYATGITSPPLGLPYQPVPPMQTPIQKAPWPVFYPAPWSAANLPAAQSLGSLPPSTNQLPQATTALQFQPQIPPVQPVWHNDLKDLFHKNQAIIYALNIRTYGAHDDNHDGRISLAQGENGTFLSCIPKLDQLANLGVNTIHLLPINPLSKTRRLGEAGSLYAPSDYHTLNPEFHQPGSGMDIEQEARTFVNECHKRGIRVMVDIPSCASADLAKARPDLIARDENGKTKTPTNWVDIVMFENGKPLQDYFQGFFDLMVNKVGVDGFRADVARARTLDFWQHFTNKYPGMAWLAESYCHEDASPLKNLPADRPQDLLRAGFDSYYGQFHIFHSMTNAKEYMDYLLSNRAMFQRASQVGGNDKSFIGSFLTHDDPSLMEHGGALMCMLATGLMTTQPFTNPYIMDGFTTGYKKDFDIFNYVPQHKGNNPEIGLMMRHMLELRKAYGPVLTQGAFIPIPVNGGDNNQVIAFARQDLNRQKTLLVVANKDINTQQKATLNLPGLNRSQPMINLVPGYGRPSYFYPDNNQLSVDLGPGRFHVFEINTPNLADDLHIPADLKAQA